MNGWAAYDLPELKRRYGRREQGRWTLPIYVEGVHCGSCIWSIRQALARDFPAVAIDLNAASGRGQLSFPEDQSLAAVLERIAALGFKPRPYQLQRQEQELQRQNRRQLLGLAVAGLGMMQVMMFAAALYAGAWLDMDQADRQLFRWVSFIFTTPVLFYSGWPFLRSAFLALKNRTLNMDVPIAFALLAAYLASLYNSLLARGEVYFESVTMFVFFLSLSRHLEFLTRRRALLNGLSLVQLLPEAVERWTGDRWQLTALELIEAGQRVRVLPERPVPVDGVIIQGESLVDEAFLTGESLGQRRGPGQRLLAGSNNLTGTLEVEVSASGGDTVLATIQNLMLRAESQKARQLRLNLQIAQWTVWGVLALALAGYGLWQFIDPSRAFDVALAVLVATCPCALSLATTTVLTEVLNGAFRQRILIKDSATLEKLLTVRHIIFDKTGTLTEGKFRLVREHYLGDPAPLKHLAKSLELHSQHPLAALLVELSQAAPLPLENLQVVPGAGVMADYRGQRWRIGSAAFCGQVEQPGSWVYLCADGTLRASWQLADQPRSGLQELFKALAGYQLHLASGDGPDNVVQFAAHLPFNSVAGGLTAADKLALLDKLDGVKLMVGDGINDGPVLAGADVSLAVASGHGLAQRQADMVLLGRDLTVLPQLFALARRCRRLIRQNLLWAVFYNLLIIPLALAGLLQPWLAALGMSLSSLLVVANGLRAGQPLEKL